MTRPPTVAGRVSVVMPAYRLAVTIGANIDRTVDALAPLDDFEVVVVDDGSDDGTGDAARRAASQLPQVSVVSYATNRGKGAALQRGFEDTSGATVVFLDGDLDLPPEQIPGFLVRFDQQDVDVLVGAKQRAMSPGTYPALRRVLSRIFSVTISVLFRLPVSETQTGLKAFRRKPLEDFLPDLEVKRYTFDLELLVKMKRAGYRIGEAPVTLAEGASATGVSIRTLWEMGRDTAATWLRSLRW